MITAAPPALKFDAKMYQAALAYYGLPANYNRVFKQIPKKDPETGNPIKADGTPTTLLRSCRAATESKNSNAVWVQVNQPHEDAAKTEKGYPKKAKNEDIAQLANVTLDFEYPPEPAKALRIGQALAAYLVERGLAEPGLPIENSGAGPHIGLPLPAIEVTKETAKRWNKAVKAVVQREIVPEFNRLREQEQVEMDLSGYDISRVLSLPGTWRPPNPAKPDCEALKLGHLRCWLAPYTNGKYPTRKECTRLAVLIQEEYAKLEANPEPRRRQEQDSAEPAQWLEDYAAQHSNNDRSALFQSLVNAVYLKYGENIVLDLKETINALAGSKYDGRLDTELQRALDKAKDLPRSSYQDYRPGPILHSLNGTGAGGGMPLRVLVSPGDVPLPEVIIGGQLRDVTQDSLEALYQDDKIKPSIFVQSARLVQVACNEKGRPIIVQMGVAELKNALTRSANYFRLKKEAEANGGGWINVPVSPPKEIAEAILALNPSTWPFPALEAIVETPVMRPDGSILDTSGYDAATRLYYYPHVGMEACKVSATPTREDIQAALALIWDTIGEFPYVDDADKANALALLLTPMLRHAIKRHVPMALIDAPKQGTGKGLLADTTSIIGTGSSSPILTMSDSEEELQKSLTSLLMEGATIITIDNVSGRLQSRHLDAVLTADTWRGRVLGQSRMVTVPQRATWLATGNNIRLGGDLARRCYRIRLDPKMSRPWMRSNFKHADLATWVTEHRAELVVALLTLARAWFVAGQPMSKSVPSLGTFTNWAKMVGGILESCGVSGFLTNLEQLYDEADEEGAQWEAFFTVWREVFGSEWKTTSQVVEHLTPADSAADSAKNLLAESLPEYLQVAFKENAKSFAIKLGKALEKRIDACFGQNNLRLERSKDSHTKGKKWRIYADSADSPTTYAQSEFETTSDDEMDRENENKKGLEHYPHYPQAINEHSPSDGSTSETNDNSLPQTVVSTLSAGRELSAEDEAALRKLTEILNSGKLASKSTAFSTLPEPNYGIIRKERYLEAIRAGLLSDDPRAQGVARDELEKRLAQGEVSR